jgi:hypothetical protein
MDIKRNKREGVDWINVDQDREIWRAVVNKEMNLRILYNAVEFLVS